MLKILTLNGGGVATIKRLIDSMDRHVKDLDFEHVILVQGDPEARAYLEGLNKSNLHVLSSDTNLRLGIGYNHMIEYAAKYIPNTSLIMLLDDDFELKANAPKLLIDYKDKNNLDIAAMEHSWYCAPMAAGKKYVECGGGTILFHKNVLSIVGYIDENMHTAWDADMLRRATLCHGLTLSVAPGSKPWAHHYSQVGQRRHGMDRFRRLRNESMDYIARKYGIVINTKTPHSDIAQETLDKLRALDPLQRQHYLKGSGITLKYKGLEVVY